MQLLFYCVSTSLQIHLTHHVQPIIEKVDSDVEDATYQLVLAIGVYEPPPSKDYVRLIEAELQRMREALA